ncbi:hypothetical protein ACF058_27470 [Streptomyces sp. NPDC015501]|uniref:hypothetical protein n=1 Tax=unclassified Streptomyces TaxID=2593676 RepID=UPI00119E97AE|nr:hypothetical protein A3L22_28815 [Streptomyces griseus subsp. griseus]
MTRPLSSAECSIQGRTGWLREEERKAVESRGDIGRMEFWLRVTRTEIAREIKTGRDDVITAFTLVCRLFKLVLEKRQAGDPRLFDHLMQYADTVLRQHGPRS